MEPHPEAAVLDGLDALLRALDLAGVDGGPYEAVPDSVRPIGHVYGGQLLAQAVMAAGRSTDGRAPSSLHALFLRAGTGRGPLGLAVDRTRDGRSMSTRQVTVSEEGSLLLIAMVSFHNGRMEPEVTVPPPISPPPGECPSLQHWARSLPADLIDHGRHWIQTPPPIEFRLPQAPSFLGGTLESATRSHWMRLPRTVADDRLLHCALLAYASDFFLMDMVFHMHPESSGPGRANGLSLDHAIWFHRPVHFDAWHLYSQEALAVSGSRGLARGTVHDSEGHLVATVMQEVLLLPADRP